MYFDVERGGTLELFGNHPTNMWGRLRQTARKGDHTLFVQGQMDWQPGDQVIVGTTGKDASETEWLTVFATRYVPSATGGWDTEINVETPFKCARRQRPVLRRLRSNAKGNGAQPFPVVNDCDRY